MFSFTPTLSMSLYLPPPSLAVDRAPGRVWTLRDGMDYPQTSFVDRIDGKDTCHERIRVVPSTSFVLLL